MEMGQGGGQVPPGGGYGGQPGYGQPQAPQGGAYPTQQYQQGGGGGAADVAQTVQRAMRTPETKPFFLTSEFAVWLLTVIGLLIAGAVTKSGQDHGDVFPAAVVWICVTVIGLAYIVSRGISKAGQKYRGGPDGGAGSGGNW